MELKKKFGITLRQLREKNDYSQEYVAEKLGIGQNTYSQWELGRANLKLESLPKLAEIYEMDVMELAGLLFEEGNFFYNYQQQGGYAANVVNTNAVEQLKKIYESMYEARIKQLEGEIDFLRSLVQTSN